MASEAGISYFTVREVEALTGALGRCCFSLVCISITGFCLKKATVKVPVFAAYGFAGLIIYYFMPLKFHFFLFFFFKQIH